VGYRVVHCGTGNIGTAALRAILEQPMPAVTCVPAVCEAKPGLLGPLDVPRYWARNVAARAS
jgi:hypothetical protein